MSKLSAYYVTGFNGFQQFTDLVEGVDSLETGVASSKEKRAKKQQNESRICFLSFTRLRYLKYLLFSWSTTFFSEADDEKLVSHGYEKLSEHFNAEKQGIFPFSTDTSCNEERVVNPEEEVILDFAATSYVKIAYAGCPRGHGTVPFTAVAEAINGNVAKHFIITNKEEVLVCNRKEEREKINWIENRVIRKFHLSDDFSVKDVSCGKEHTLLLTDNGRVYSFGTGSKGQLGLGSLESHKEPVYVDALEPLIIREINAGGWHSLALTGIQSWGWNQSGQLGIGCFPEDSSWGNQRPCSTVQSCKRVLFGTLPNLVDVTEDIVSVSCGSRHSAAVLRDNSLLTWGWNGYGQLGQGDKVDRHCPKSVEGLNTGAFSKAKVVCNAWNTIICLQA
ncbi:RCC1 and BTB domain-containing protein 2-like isoform X2 [Rhopilema esculentum]|uniref:RCC1 and BTB domain-containing protein 2-like isoform X2 n=1 Tax=Rhopilema esculentum TaxID=499914 RepID=UPI0031D7A87F